MNEKPMHVNRPQMEVQVVNANETFVVAGRGVGKSSGIASFWILDRVKKMPRSSGFMLGCTYQQILTRTLPPVLSMFTQMGLVRDVHYCVGRRPPENWPDQPLVAPEDYKNTVSFANGTIMYLISQDRPGIPNSLSLCWGVIDEAKMVDMDRFRSDLSPAIRGFRHLFGHLPEYQSLLWMTDQPTSPDGQWIWEHEKRMNPAQIELIKRIYLSHQKALVKLANCKTEPTRLAATTEVNNWAILLNKARMNSVLYLEASAIDNIDVLGAEYIRKQKALLPDYTFNVSILNQRMTRIDGGFYPYLDDKRICYTLFDNSYLESLEIGAEHVLDCRQDSDLNTGRPLEFGCDHGSSINCMVVGQRSSSFLRIVNFLFVTHPQTTEDLANQFCEYYEPFRKKNKKVIYHYDQTSIATHGKAQNITYVSELLSVLKKRGWEVEENYLGATTSHNDRYKLAARHMRPDGIDRGIPLVMNRHHTEVLRLAMHTTPAIQGRHQNEIRKDKSSERKKDVAPEKATHPTDAFDTLLVGMTGLVDQDMPTNMPSPIMVA